MIELAPSILSADFSRLGEDVKQIENAGAHLIHVDVMDGHFVPNISYGATVMKSLCGRTQMPFDVHLMIENPDQYIGDFVTEQTEYITDVYKRQERTASPEMRCRTISGGICSIIRTTRSI